MECLLPIESRSIIQESGIRFYIQFYCEPEVWPYKIHVILCLNFLMSGTEVFLLMTTFEFIAVSMNEKLPLLSIMTISSFDLMGSWHFQSLIAREA